MEDIARILSPSSASWVTWVLLFLLSIVVLNRSVLLSISTVWHSLLSYSDRMYTTGRAQSVLNTFLSVVFRWGVMGLSIYVLCYESGDFMALTYVKLLGGVGAMLLVQWLMSFLVPVQRESISEQRTIIYNAACVILLFCLMLMIHTSSIRLRVILVSVFVILLMGMMFFRAIQLFGQKPWKVLYVFLYIITLELLPLIGVTIWAKQII